MAALRRFLAILLADLRERTRSPRFWILLTAMVVFTWWCFPGPEANYLVLAPDSGVREKYTLCASLRRPDGVRVRVVAADRPHADAQAVTPGLEDAYTWLLGKEAKVH